MQSACLSSSIQQVLFTHLAQAGQVPQGEVNTALRIKGCYGHSGLISPFLMRKLRLLKVQRNVDVRSVITTKVSILPVYPVLYKTRFLSLSLERGPFKCLPGTVVVFTTPSTGKTDGYLPDESQLWLFIQQISTVGEVRHVHFYTTLTNK